MADNTGTSPARSVNPDNHGGYIVIAAALLMTWSLLFWLIRVTIRVGYNHYFASDDVVATIGTFLGTVQAILVIVAVKTAGLGQKIDKLSASSVHRTELLVYSTDLLFPLVLACAKAATSELIARLTRQRQHVLACRVLSSVSIVWGLASFLSIAIGCHPSHPWDLVDRCSDLYPSWLGIGIIDILIELCLFALPVTLVYPLHMSRNSKAVVLSAFGSRLPLIIVTAFRLKSLDDVRGSSNYTFDLVLPAVLTQVEQHYGLMAMTILCLRPFLKAFDTGTLATTAAQIEIGMGAQANTQRAALQSTIRPWRWSARHASSSVSKSTRNSISSTIKSEDKAPQKRPEPFETIPENTRSHTVPSAASHRTDRSDEKSMLDNDSIKPIVPKAEPGQVQWQSSRR